jgi:hypothetical protein
MSTPDQITWALAELDANSPRLRRYVGFKQYYDGIQPLAFATDKYRTQFWSLFRGFADNMCQSVVDVQAERLEIIGFTSSTAETEEMTLGASESPDEDATDDAAEGEQDVPNFPGVVVSVVDDPMGDEAWDEWEDRYLPLVADQVHSDSFLYGDGFVIVDENGVWRQDPCQMAVRYSIDKPGIIELAAKMWMTLGKRLRLNIYSLEDDGTVTMTRYQSRRAFDGKSQPKLGPSDFDVLDSEDFKAMPVVHFPNKRYGAYGISEIQPVIPLQNALNKASMDLIIAMEYQAFQQRWIAGVDVEIDPATGLPKEFVGKHGPGNYLAIADSEAKIGQFDAADLEPYVKVVTDLRAQIARVSGVPPNYFFSNGGATVSGEALKTGEIRFTRKGKRQQRCFGKGWEAVMTLVLVLPDDATETYTDEDLNALWDDVEPRSPSEEMDVLLKKQVIGVPNSQLQREAGYDPDQVLQFAVEFAEQIKLGLVANPNPAPNPAKAGAQPAQVAIGESPASSSAGGQKGDLPATASPRGDN